MDFLTATLRILSADMVENAKSGHPGMPLGMADVMTVLYRDFLRFHPKAPAWQNRDRLVFSAGHGSALLYALLYLTGYPDYTLEELKRFRQRGSITAGHPEYDISLGIEATTGPLGQGIANGVGMAIAAKMLAERVGGDIINHKVYVVCGDGCLMEGISYEAMSLAGHLRLDNLVVLFDDNNISIDGSTSLSRSEDIGMRCRSGGWEYASIDGHNESQIVSVLSKASAPASSVDKRPKLIACKTIIGYGTPTKRGTCDAHGTYLGNAELSGLREYLKWPYEPFHIPEDKIKAWRKIGEKCAQEYDAWNYAVSLLDDEKKRFVNSTACEEHLQARTDQALAELRHINLELRKEQDGAGGGPQQATRKASKYILERLSKYIDFVGGSADLSESNGTKLPDQKVITADDFSGSYIYHGVREHSMFGIMNGIALYNENFIPYGGTFLIFSDYARPAIRLAAMMSCKVVYIMTHDSIGLGEDGPTHQPVEQLASLRCIPGLKVFRPCDFLELVNCWEKALLYSGPVLFSLTRQKVQQIPRAPDITFSEQGYLIYRSPDGYAGAKHVNIVATGSEVSLGYSVAKLLEGEGVSASVISVPCKETYSMELAEDDFTVVIEAAVEYGWRDIQYSIFFGVKKYGISAPGKDVYEYFELTPEKIKNRIIQAI